MPEFLPPAYPPPAALAQPAGSQPPHPAPGSEADSGSGSEFHWWMGLVLLVPVIAVLVISFLVAPKSEPADTCPEDLICLSAKQLVDEYAADIATAQATYQGRHVAVSGSLDAIRNETGAYTVILSPYSLGGSAVGCRDLPYDDVQTWNDLHPNDLDVVLVGKVVSSEVRDQRVIVALTGCRLRM